MKPYNEVYDSDNQLRPAYKSFQSRTGYDPLKPSQKWIETCFSSPMGDQLQFFPIPLILDDKEYREVLKPGVEQRMKTFQHFFRDIAIGDGKILKPGAPLEGMPLEWLFRDQGVSLEGIRKVFEGADENSLRFVYGPDMIRNSDGKWMIIEDNIGIIGGMSECFFAVDAFLRETGTRLNTVPKLENDLEKAVKAFLKDAGVRPEDALGLTPYDDYEPALTPFEKDSVRKTELLKSMGIPSWNVASLTEEKRAKALAGEFKALVNFSSAKWRPKKEFNLELFKRMKIPMLEAPLIKYTSTKGFLPFMEAMVRFYLNEEPILRSPETRLMMSPELPDASEKWVLKQADEAEGKGVLVLPRLFPSQREAAQQAVKDWMSKEEGYVVVQQRYLTPSYVPASVAGGWLNFLVDLRPISYAYGFEKFHVSENLNARAISALGDPRNCVTRGAMVLPVIREKTE